MSLNRHLLLVITADFVNCVKEKHVKTLLIFYIIKNYNEEI